MKALSKLMIVAQLAVLTGCVAVPGVYSRGMYSQGAYNYSSYGVAPVRSEPCQPYKADSVTDWAKELPNDSRHSRSANVTNSNGLVTCNMNESASSNSNAQKK